MTAAAAASSLLLRRRQSRSLAESRDSASWLDSRSSCSTTGIDSRAPSVASQRLNVRRLMRRGAVEPARPPNHDGGQPVLVDRRAPSISRIEQRQRRGLGARPLDQPPGRGERGASRHSAPARCGGRRSRCQAHARVDYLLSRPAPPARTCPTSPTCPSQATPRGGRTQWSPPPQRTAPSGSPRL